MICVSIGRGRHKMVSAEHRSLADRGAELVEIRLDWIGRKPNLARLLADRPTPTVLTARRPEDQGRWQWGEEHRLTVLREAILSGVEYVDLEVDIAGSVPRYGETKRIVSYHNFEETPENLEEIHSEMCAKDPDIVKLVTMATSPIDNVRILNLVQKSEVPMVGFCMGEMGTMSRVLCGRYGAPFTYASFDSDRAMAPGQLSFKDVKYMYRFNRLTDQSKVFAVLGDPIGHSMSPLVHNVALQASSIDGVYLPLHIPAEQFKESLDAFQTLGLEGYSVTIPHKEAALEYAQVRDTGSTEVGASNTLFRRDEQWHAANTDYSAAMQALEQVMVDSDRGTLIGKTVLMLGAGGVARAIGLGIVRAGGVLTIANRTTERAEQLAMELGCQHVGWAARGSVNAHVVINCTPIGMFPNMGETPYEGNWFRDHAVAFDTVYNPENTLFLKLARDREVPTVSGLEMFVLQAARQFEIFTGMDAPMEKMRDAVRYGISGRG